MVCESCRKDSFHSTVDPCATNSHIKRPVSYVPTKCSYIFSKINPLLKYEHFFKRTTDTVLCPESHVIYRQPFFTDSGYQTMSLESFRLDDKNEYEYDNKLKVFPRVL